LVAQDVIIRVYAIGVKVLEKQLIGPKLLWPGEMEKLLRKLFSKIVSGVMEQASVNIATVITSRKKLVRDAMEKAVALFVVAEERPVVVAMEQARVQNARELELRRFLKSTKCFLPTRQNRLIP